MTLPTILAGRLALPLIAAPMFIVSQPELVLAQCRAGIVGSFPSLNARPSGMFEAWLDRLQRELTGNDAPFAVNLIVHRTNARLEEDLALCVQYRVPIVITSLGAQSEVNARVRGYGGIVLHDVIHDRFARKAIEKGASGLIAVGAGAGGHAGTVSPFALVREIREWFDGPLALSGAIATGEGIAAAQAMGADLAYMGSAFIATEEAHASTAYKQMIVDCGAEDIVYSARFTGIHGNYLKPSIVAAGIDLATLDGQRGDLGALMVADVKAESQSAKPWRDVWGAGQGIGAVKAVVSTADLVVRLQREYRAALGRLASGADAPAA